MTDGKTALISPEGKEMKYYKVPEDHLRKLLEAEDLLESLNCNGVDEWKWYSEAINDHNKDLESRMNIELSKFEKLPD